MNRSTIIKGVLTAVVVISAVSALSIKSAYAGADETWCKNATDDAATVSDVNDRYHELNLAPYRFMARDICCVRSPFWMQDTNAGRARLPLGRAIRAASDGQACLEKIVINMGAFSSVNNIKMREPIVIDRATLGNATFSNGEWSGKFFEITSADDEPVLLDATDIDYGDGHCAVKVSRGHTRFTNIVLSGVTGENAVCINNSNNVLDRLQITGMTAPATKAAIRLGAVARGNWILPTSFPQDIGSAVAIKVMNESFDHGNRFFPTNEALLDTGPDGFAMSDDPPRGQTVDQLVEGVLSPVSEGRTIGVQSIPTVALDPEKFIKTEIKVRVQIFSIDVDGTGKALVQGRVIDTSDPGADLCGEDVANSEVTKLQVYETNGNFIGYVTPIDTGASAGGGSNLGLINVGERGNGDFIFRVASGKRIIIVPELAGGSIASSSKVYTTSDVVEDRENEYTECSELRDPTVGGGGGAGGATEMFTSYQDCYDYRRPDLGLGRPAYGYNTDGDGYTDDEEDINKNCVCDAGETCFISADTDNDGIPDKMGAETMTATDTDSDGIKNVLDPDSDNDGVEDGREDRNQYTYTTNAGGTTHTQNLLYRFQDVFSASPIQKADGSGPATCELGANDTIGVRYGWYYTDSTHPDPVRLNEWPETTQTGWTVRMLVCRNQSLNSPVNFNGAYDQDNAEMNFLSADTDGDEWCDGPGDVSASKCIAPAITHGNIADTCPLIDNDPSSENRCGGDMPCFEKQVFYTTDYRYVDWDGEGNPLNLRDGWETNPGDGTPREADGVPDVYQVAGGCLAIESLCGDTDQDGIPDCVENPGGLCPGGSARSDCGEAVRTGSGDPIGLRHYCSDTDGDGKFDGWKGTTNSDVCPTTSGADGFSENGTYSCRPEDFYVARQVIACFLDRDGDTLKDAMEDKNLNGRYDAVIQNIAGIGSTESNAMSRDSDGDMISDSDEINGWPTATNPADADTDDDSLSDKDEDRDGDGRITVTMLEGQGCQASVGKDTNPAIFDTDGDLLGDGAEIDGSIPADADFMRMILEPATWSGGGIVIASSPLAIDSDSDGLDDNVEYNGDRITYYDSNPCMRDSDGDSREDQDELRGCRLNSDTNCVGSADGSSAGGLDADGDQLPNDVERTLGTNENLPDTDGDGVWDGIEDANHNGIYEPNLRESNATNPDTDGDGLRDGMELRYGTDATNADTDGDCIPDGLEDANHNGSYDPVETNALEADTDGDGLPDGYVRGIGEDLDCNGMRNVNPDGGFTETDPTNPDSDYDGNNDRDEMFSGGSFNVSNVGRANSGQEGCSMMGTAGKAPSSMYYLLGLVLFATRIIRRKLRQGS